MRLWHEDLISKLPRQQLLGQHREIAALRGNAWGKPHSVVNYVFKYSPYRLYLYHLKVMDEMKKRGYKPDKLWENPYYRGKNCEAHRYLDLENIIGKIYPEHDDKYYKECIENLRNKGILL
ncbi:pyrimidine dimer DNA glycosylase [Clostridium acetireducens DSM 10703]|uniref:Pyrimidine dimer DNA glycosylase n=1 Tax=Clostridium acetireducens DSM 10703 TaxID=1121290 RepID=A0A1E8EUV2_9CLOT|nr:TIGR02328 family protein [Clostridium acetireducens]OFH97998.1 pyrimidine dimer DNA glycosylase [Clostridium acetireducens DSM 10703]